jgi:hypothetical protein
VNPSRYLLHLKLPRQRFRTLSRFRVSLFTFVIVALMQISFHRLDVLAHPILMLRMIFTRVNLHPSLGKIIESWKFADV